MRWLLPSLAVFLTGCAFMGGLFTKPTGTVCVPRQEFVNTYGVIEVLARSWFADEEARCQGDRCGQIRMAKFLAKRVDATAQAKLAHPEVELDKEAIKELLSVLVSLVP